MKTLLLSILWIFLGAFICVSDIIISQIIKCTRRKIDEKRLKQIAKKGEN